MTDRTDREPHGSNPIPGDEVQLPLKDVVLSNSWALQAILEYLEEENPGAKDRIWKKYLAMKSLVESQPPSSEPS